MAAPATATVFLSDVPDDISECFLPYQTTLRQRQRATLFSNGQCVHSVKLEKSGEDQIEVSAKAYRSQVKTESPHKISITVDSKQRCTTDAFCSCKAGISGQCSHVLAVLYTLGNWILAGLKDVPSDAACTSLPQQWDKPRGRKITAEPVSSMVMAKPGKTNRKRKPITAIFKDNRKSPHVAPDSLMHLRAAFSDRPIAYLVQDVAETVSTEQEPQLLGSTLATQVPLICQVAAASEVSLQCGNVNFPKPRAPLFPVPPCVLDQQQEWSHLRLTIEEARRLEQNTIDQTLSSMWFIERKKRITASYFGRFMTRKAPITDSFLNSIYNVKSFVSVPTTYGTANEKIVREKYIRKSKLHVHNCGLVVNPDFPFLAASPDGKVCDHVETGILEIKCPYSIRDLTISEAVECAEKRHLIFLEKCDDSIRLKRTHLYWYQVQGQLLVTGASFCDFVCYTKVDLHIERIKPDIQTMTDMLIKLKGMYIEHVKKYLTKKLF